jgi:hypothetical protein
MTIFRMSRPYGMVAGPQALCAVTVINRRIGCFLFAIAALMASLGVQAELRLEIPDETFGPPFYARLAFGNVEADMIPNDGKWAALVIYRQRECIPEDFNLLAMFDVPTAFFCPLNDMTGFEVWENEPGVDPAPIRSRMSGAESVPVWFVHLDEFEQAASDGVVTIVDFEAMPSLKRGSADFFDELLRPSEANPVGFIHINARGSFEDGGRFRLTYTTNGAFGPEHGNLPATRRTRIEFPGEDARGSDGPLVSPYTGHWTDLSNVGQGLGLHPVRGTDYFFGTYYAIDEFGQQVWYALDGLEFDGMRAHFAVLLSHGANAEAPNGVEIEQVGEMTIDFLGCRAARAAYSINGLEADFDMVSVVPADDCTD